MNFLLQKFFKWLKLVAGSCHTLREAISLLPSSQAYQKLHLEGGGMVRDCRKALFKSYNVECHGIGHFHSVFDALVTTNGSGMRGTLEIFVLLGPS
uniref:Uncharacterized protein n=1 Tax=Rhipicephalus zambeziensis TaxID=60191 RepID=A0A224YGS8_9ACAR